jgi:hypothetical protein
VTLKYFHRKILLPPVPPIHLLYPECILTYSNIHRDLPENAIILAKKWPPENVDLLAMSVTQELSNFLVDCICISQFLKCFNLLREEQILVYQL